MGFVFKLYSNTYTLNGSISGVLPSGVAKFKWAIPTPPEPSLDKRPVLLLIKLIGPLEEVLMFDLGADRVCWSCTVMENNFQDASGYQKHLSFYSNFAIQNLKNSLNSYQISLFFERKKYNECSETRFWDHSMRIWRKSIIIDIWGKSKLCTSQ